MSSNPKSPRFTRRRGGSGRSQSPLHARVLVIDVGGTHVKLYLSGRSEARRFVSGRSLTAAKMVATTRRMTRDWHYDAVSIGYPGPVLHGRAVAEPHNLARGWLGYNFRKAFGCPVQLVNDAALQALGSYRAGKMLFLGLGTGLGSALVIDGAVAPMELAHLPYRKRTYEDYVGLRGLRRLGKKKWRRHVEAVVESLIAALEADEVVLGGGNIKHLKTVPPRCRLGSNANAFLGGLRLWRSASSGTGVSPGAVAATIID